MGFLLRSTAISIALLLVAAGIFAIGVARWTQYQLRPGPLSGICLVPRDLAQAESGRLDPRPLLARAAIDRGYPGRRWSSGLNWHFTYAKVTWLGFLFIPRAEQLAMLDRLPRCRRL